MRRALPAILATLGGLGLLASFHTAGGASRQTTAAPVTSPTAATGSSPPPSGTSPQSTTPAGTTPQTTAPAALTSGHQQIDGSTISTRYGDVQVRVILDNGKITDVQPLKMPSDRRRSAEITQAATPVLHDEVLQVQSAQIDLVSGATYTSDAYQQSLQAALDQSRK
jgi:uncharacterized protein with FMN-binding domain